MTLLNVFGIGSGIFVMLWMLSAVSAQNELELPLRNELDSSEEIQELLRTIQLLFEKTDNVTDNDNARCNCGGMTCQCCQYINLRKLRLRDNCCLSVTYLPRNYGILVVLRFGSRTLFSKEVSARNPPPICIGIPYLTKGASVCIQFYNMNVARRSFSGCGRLLARLLFVTIANINLGCFRMNFIDDLNQSDTMELPYLDGPQGFVNDSPPLDKAVRMEQLIPAQDKNKN